MNKLLTSGVSGAIKKQPLLSGSIEFMQNAFKESLNGLALAVIGSNVTTGQYALTGVTRPTISSPTITNGFIWYNGEIYYFAGIGNYDTFGNTGVFVAANTYLSPDPITYSDGTTGSVHQQRRLNLVDQANGTGLFNFSDLSYSPQQLARTKIISIGNWDMDANASLSVAHGLASANIRDVRVSIIEDIGTFRSSLDFMSDGSWSWDGTNVNMNRKNGGTFDSVNYDSASFNRGYITIHYV